jgi:hypothetical protein
MMQPTRAQQHPVDTMTRRIKGYRGDHPRLYRRMVSECRNMASGGDGGPHRMGYTWTTVRHAYFMNWTDAMFVRVLEELGEHI